MDRDVYYNKSGCYDPTAGEAISNTSKNMRVFYTTRKWRRCRNGFMANRYFVCERCGGVATIAHHKKPITAENISNPDITLNWDNLEAVCYGCHSAIHGGGGAVFAGVTFDEDGNLKYSPPHRD